MFLAIILNVIINVILMPNVNNFRSLEIHPRYINSKYIVDVGEYCWNFDPGHQRADGKIELYALVIGIEKYKNSSWNLDYAEDDAIAWNSYLKNLGYNVTLLRNEEATAENIMKALEKVLSWEDEDDYLVFVYSGHGIYNSSTKRSAIVSYDLYAITSALLAEIFVAWLDCSHFFMFFDACYIGAMSEIAEYRSGVYIAMASDISHKSYESKNFSHGVFTYYFLEVALIEHGIKVLQEAFDYAKHMIETEWNKYYPGRAMYPTEADSYLEKMYLVPTNEESANPILPYGTTSPILPY